MTALVVVCYLFGSMEGWQIAIVLKPLGLLVLFAFVHSIAMLVKKYLPDGKLKRFLFISWKV